MFIPEGILYSFIYSERVLTLLSKYIHGEDWNKFNPTKQYQAKRMETLHRWRLLPNTFHPTIKFTAEISENEITFLDTVVFKGERFIEKSILDIKTHYKPTETFQYTHFTSCHPPGVKRGFIKREAIRLLRTNSSKTTYEEYLANVKRRLEARGYLASHADVLYGFVTQSFLPHERLLQPVVISVRLCFETTNQPSPIILSLANSNFCKKRSCRPQGNFRETFLVNKLFSFNSCFS